MACLGVRASPVRTALASCRISGSYISGASLAEPRAVRGTAWMPRSVMRGTRLHEWFFATRTFHAMQGQPAGRTGTDDALASTWNWGIGADIMGRAKFGPHHGPWLHQEWIGWSGVPPFHTPVFALIHHPRPRRTAVPPFTSSAPALAQARQAAAGRDIRIGGPSAIREFPGAGLVDHLHIVVVPIVLGRGERLWDGLEALEDRFRIEAVNSPGGLTHVILS